MQLRITVPDDDPRFAALLSVIQSASRPGRGSMVPRMLAEWLLDGYRLYAGAIAAPGMESGGCPGTVRLGDGRVVNPVAMHQQHALFLEGLAMYTNE